MTNYTLDPSSGPLASLLAAMDCVALEIVGNSVSVVSALPPWLESIARTDAADAGIVTVLPFLEIFLHEALAHWETGRGSQLQSDFWTQNDASGREIHLLALAAVIDGRKLVVIRSANDLYEERQRWQLYAHQTSMQLTVIERLKSELEQSTFALREANDRLSEMSIRDGLTNLYNRRHFDNALQMEMNRALRSGKPLSLLLLDVDQFKVLNDTYGHSTGDACLREVAKVLEQAVQRSSDLVARFGGEEFAILLPATEASNALAIATALKDAVLALNFPNKNSSVMPILTASLGTYTWQPESSSTMAQLLDLADGALYQAKKAGRNRVVVAAQL